MPQQLDVINETSMSFGDHLDELRRRLIHGLLGVGVAVAVALFFGWPIITWLLVPLNRAQREAGLPAMAVGHSVTTGFMVYLKVSLVAGLIIGSPWLIYQVWRFVSAGLYANERRVVVLIAPFSGGLSALAVAFTYYIMLPVCLTFLIGFSARYPMAGGTEPALMDRFAQTVGSWVSPGEREPAAPLGDPLAETAVFPSAVVLVPVLEVDPSSPAEGQIWIDAHRREVKVHYVGVTRVFNLATGAAITPLIDIERYIGFVAMLMLGVVLAFQLPLVMLIAGWTGVVDPVLVTQYRRHCFFGCFVLGAVFTPADPISMLVLAAALILLFELGLYLMRRTYPARHA
jgi:sec-independent protein translocase protein TatC